MFIFLHISGSSCFVSWWDVIQSINVLYGYSFMTDYMFNSCKMTATEALPAMPPPVWLCLGGRMLLLCLPSCYQGWIFQRNRAFPDFYFDDIMTSFIFSLYLVGILLTILFFLPASRYFILVWFVGKPLTALSSGTSCYGREIWTSRVFCSFVGNQHFFW